MTTEQVVAAGDSTLERCSIDDLTRLVRDRDVTRLRRLSAGAELARRGDPRPGILTLEPDWCVVAGGTFVMGGGRATGSRWTGSALSMYSGCPRFAYPGIQ